MNLILSIVNLVLGVIKSGTETTPRIFADLWDSLYSCVVEVVHLEAVIVEVVACTHFVLTLRMEG